MKNFITIVLFFAVGFFAIYEQSKPNPNPFFMIGAMAIFMYGLYSIMKKIPNKNDEDDAA